MPTPSDYHVNALLTNFAIEKGVGGAFAADLIYPVIPVKKESDTYWSYPSPELRDDVDALRAAGDMAKEVDWKPTTATYSAKEYALRRALPWRALDNADDPNRVKMETVRKLVHKIRLGIEKRIKSVVMSTTYITNNTSPSVKWDASSGTINIEGNIDAAKEAVVAACGHEPNVIVIPPAVARVVKRNSTLRDLVRYTDPKLLINGDLPPVLFNLRVVIPGAIELTSNPAQTDSIARIWSTDNVLVAYVDDALDTESITLGKQFRVKKRMQGDDLPIMVREYENTEREATFIEVSVIQDEKLVSAACGYLLTDVLT
jgi:hypothetical protein